MNIRIAPLLATALLAVTSSVLAAGPTLVWRGDLTTARGVVEDVARAWQRSGHGHIELQPFNTVSGLDAVIHGSADLAGSARPAYAGRPGEASLQFTPVAWDALVMITHPRNPVHSLTLKQVHDIYFGKITNWSQVGGRNAPIDLYAVASPTDGVEFSLRRLLYGRGIQPVAAPRLYVNVAKLEEGITLDPNGLGVSTMAGVRGNPKIKVLAIDGKSPTPANIADGSYPLYTPLYLVTRNDASGPKAQETQAFVDFLHSDKAEAILRRHLLLPYADGANLAAQEDTRMARIADEVGRVRHNGPTAAPRATYAAGAANAPTSPLTLEARQRLEQERKRQALQKKAEEASEHANKGGNSQSRADAPARFRGIEDDVRSTARPGFGDIESLATTLQRPDRRFAAVHGGVLVAKRPRAVTAR